jgi:hypothetical protein
MDSARTRVAAALFALASASTAGSCATSDTDEPESRPAPEQSPAAAAAEPPAPVPLPFDDTANLDREATLRVALAAGATLWFHEQESQEHSFGASDDPHRTTSEVNLLLSATGSPAADGEGTEVRLRFERVWGKVDDGSVLAFDTGGSVPQVFCRLDDVRPEIALAGREIRFVVSPDGRLRSAGDPPIRTTADMIAFLHAKSLLGASIRRGEPVASGASWEETNAITLGGMPINYRVATRVGPIGRGSVVMAQEFSADGGKGPLGAPAVQGVQVSHSVAGTESIVLSRSDGLVLLSDGEKTITMSMQSTREGDAGRGMEMRHHVRTRVRRVEPPATR